MSSTDPITDIGGEGGSVFDNLSTTARLGLYVAIGIGAFLLIVLISYLWLYGLLPFQHRCENCRKRCNNIFRIQESPDNYLNMKKPIKNENGVYEVYLCKKRCDTRKWWQMITKSRGKRSTFQGDRGVWLGQAAKDGGARDQIA